MIQAFCDPSDMSHQSYWYSMGREHFSFSFQECYLKKNKWIFPCAERGALRFSSSTFS